MMKSQPDKNNVARVCEYDNRTYYDYADPNIRAWRNLNFTHQHIEQSYTRARQSLQEFHRCRCPGRSHPLGTSPWLRWPHTLQIPELPVRASRVPSDERTEINSANRKRGEGDAKRHKITSTQISTRSGSKRFPGIGDDATVTTARFRTNSLRLVLASGFEYRREAVVC